MHINQCGFKKNYLMRDYASMKSWGTLVNFIQANGIPSALHSDNHGKFKDGLFKDEVRKYSIKHTFTEPMSPWQNPAESGIREISKLAKKWMMQLQCPVHLWYLCMIWPQIFCHCAPLCTIHCKEGCPTRWYAIIHLISPNM